MGGPFLPDAVGLDGGLEDEVCGHVAVVAVEKLHSSDLSEVVVEEEQVLWHALQEGKRSIHLAGVSTPCCEIFIPIIESKGQAISVLTSAPEPPR